MNIPEWINRYSNKEMNLSMPLSNLCLTLQIRFPSSVSTLCSGVRRGMFAKASRDDPVLSHFLPQPSHLLNAYIHTHIHTYRTYAYPASMGGLAQTRKSTVLLMAERGQGEPVSMRVDPILICSPGTPGVA